MFIDALQYGPENIPMRQIPLSSHTPLWISENGITRRRYYNPIEEKHIWGCILQPHVDENGNAYIHTGTNKLSITTAIAAAWLTNSKNRKKPRLKNIEEGSVVSNMVWSDSDSDNELILDDEKEVWTNLNENNQQMYPHTEKFEISSLGRVRNQIGETYDGTYLQNNKVICLPTRGLLNIQDCLNEHFHSKKKTKIPQRISKLIYNLRNQKTLEEYSQQENVTISTVWSYFYEACLTFDMNECHHFAKKFVSSAAFEAVKIIFENKEEHLFSQPAKIYMETIDTILCDDPNWKCNGQRYQEIRILKLLCQKCALNTSTEET